MYPSTFSAFNRPAAGDKLNSPSHAALHNTVSSAVGQLEAVIGLAGASSTIGTLIGDLRSPGSDGGGHVQTASKGGTGQTSFTKGDLLVASSASVLTKLAVGTAGQALIVDSAQPTGVKWGVPGATPVTRVYQTSSSIYTWTKSSALSYVVIELQASGGAGGPSDGSNGGGGGGGGAYVRKIVGAASLPTAASVLVRAAGVSSVLSYFGSVLSATGGVNGLASTPGDGGSVLAAGDFNLNGQAGQGPSGGNIIGGQGGNSWLGKGGAAGQYSASNTVANAGQAAFSYGAGGGGGTSALDGSPVGAGGAGSDAVIIVYEY